MACDVSTGSMMFLLTSTCLLLLSSVSTGKPGSLRCPTSVQVELGTDGVIACDIGFKFGNVFWYAGDSFSKTPPIARLENGQSEGGDGFDISTNGSLIVRDADASREGIYTIVVFYLNNIYEHSSVSLKTSVSMGKSGSLRCPTSVQVELGTDGVIACDIGFNFANLYWYAGDGFSETPPIARLENGVPEGGDGFDISTNGSLVVLGADASREGIYTIVVFHLDNTYGHSSVSLQTFGEIPEYFLPPDFPDWLKFVIKMLKNAFNW